MGFAEKWAGAEAVPSDSTPMDRMDSMDTIAPAHADAPHSVHCVQFVPRVSTLTPAELRDHAAASPPHADTPALDALAHFERNPHGVIHWLAQQKQGQPQHLMPRWVKIIQAEARARVAAAEAAREAPE